MIVFDLRCANAHVFEAWFGSSDDFGAQLARGLVTCPLCGSGDVIKAAMAASVSAKSNRAAPSNAEAKALLGKIAHAQREVLAKSDYVGTRFADEARAIHLGDAEARSIHGQATREDAQALRDEGVPVAPLPLPVLPPEREN